MIETDLRRLIANLNDPLMPDGRMIVDERCECGLLRSEHYGWNGHGAAPDCRQFTWVGFVFCDGSEGPH